MTRSWHVSTTSNAQEVPMNRVVESLYRLLRLAQMRGDRVAVIFIEQRLVAAMR
jgi:hypothetical protein